MRAIQRILSLMLVSVIAMVASSCCNRPYAAGSQTWPQKGKYPNGPYDLMVRCYRVQSGLCPKAGDKGANVTIIVWTFNHQNQLFKETFKTDRYFEDIVARFSKDGSVIVVDTKSEETIREYRRVSEAKWQVE